MVPFSFQARWQLVDLICFRFSFCNSFHSFGVFSLRNEWPPQFWSKQFCATTRNECQVEDRAGEQERGVGGGREEGKLEMEEPIFLRDRDELSDVIICLPPSESQPAHLLNTFWGPEMGLGHNLTNSSISPYFISFLKAGWPLTLKLVTSVHAIPYLRSFAPHNKFLRLMRCSLCKGWIQRGDTDGAVISWRGCGRPTHSSACGAAVQNPSRPPSYLGGGLWFLFILP